jgi:hypothetical protein
VSSPSSLSRRDVAVVPWPAQTDVREHLAALRVPRVLLISGDHEPPALLDELEDWVREGIHPDDLVARTESLAARAIEDAPVADPDGLVRFAGRWTVVPPNQVGIVLLLVERFDRVVSKVDLADAYVAAGGSGHPNSIRSVTVRLSKRLASIGLELVTIRGRGLMLTRPCGVPT